MRRNKSFPKDYAVTEIVAGMLLIVIAVVAFTVIQNYLIPPGPDVDISVRLQGSVGPDGTVILEHVGGESLENYKFHISYANGTLIGIQEYNNDIWEIGEYRNPFDNITNIKLVNDTIGVTIMVFYIREDGVEEQIFYWSVYGKTEKKFLDNPVLITTLKQDTSCEDLIAFNYTVNPDINATTYIYNWLVNGFPLAELIMPFNTNSSTVAKDYSGNGHDATVVGAEWTPNGVVGGAYYFDGSSYYLTMSVPNVFNDIANSDFTLCVWLKADDIYLDNSVALLASKDNNNFIKFFLKGEELHVGLVWNDGKDHKTAIRTEALLSNTWYHIAAVWDSNQNILTVYCNGQPYTLAGNRNFAMGVGAGLMEIAHGSASSKFWKGFIDELELYNFVLPQEQIYQMYLQSKDGESAQSCIVSSLTDLGDSWQVIITPNDGIQDGSPLTSNLLQIIGCYGGT
jgi:hypothetical protein